MANRPVYNAVVCASQTRKWPMLAYQLPNDKCFKFVYIKSSRDGLEHFYQCYGCREAKKEHDELKDVSISTIHVSSDFSRFVEDPESLTHSCVDYNKLFDSLGVAATELYRLVSSSILLSVV
jgi:hypothetical protein